MRSTKRPLVAAGTAVLLALSFAACGDDGDGADGKADDGSSSEATESGSPDPTATAEGSGAESSATGGAGGAGGSDGATDGAGAATTEEFCGGVADIVEVSSAVTDSEPNEAEWGKIQDAYADLGEIGPPADIPAKERQGFQVAVEAITSLSYAEAEKAFGDADGSSGIPGVSAEDNAKAEAFFVWAGTACPELSSGGTPTE